MVALDMTFGIIGIYASIYAFLIYLGKVDDIGQVRIKRKERIRNHKWILLALLIIIFILSVFKILLCTSYVQNIMKIPIT